MEIIDRYLNNKLAPVLRMYGAKEDYISETLKVIESQMYSLLKIWRDVPRRKAILLLGAEEGLFYEPPSKKDVRCFVVVTIRNSPLERIQSDAYAVTGASKPLTNAEVRSITSNAIQYFNVFDFEKLSIEAQAHQEKNIYGMLFASHPVTTAALIHLANSSKKQIDYPSVLINHPYELTEIQEYRSEEKATTDSHSKNVVFDGFSSMIDPELKDLLVKVTTSSIKVFLTPSFKSLTRNPEILMDILEFLLSYECAFVTPNFCFENGHVEKRINLLRACHTDEEAVKNYQQYSQLGFKHRMYIKTTLSRLTPLQNTKS